MVAENRLIPRKKRNIMPAVNIFLAHRRFASTDELRQFTLSANGTAAKFLQEVGLEEADPTKIKLIHKAEGETLFRLLAGAPDFDRWGNKVRYLAGVYDTAVLVYEPNLMKTPEASSLYYLGRLVYKYIS